MTSFAYGHAAAPTWRECVAACAERLGEVPLVGFFCNGEISRDRLCGYTGVLTLFH